MTRFWRRVAVLQNRRPGAFLLVFGLLAALGAWRASKLHLVTDFADLLNEEQPSVVELHRILGRVRGLSNVFVVLEGKDPMALRKVADALLPPLRAIGSPYVENARSGVQDARKFLMPRAGLYMAEEDLQDLETRLGDAERAAHRKAIGADFGGDDDAGEGGGLDADEIERRLTAKGGSMIKYPDGYYQVPTPDGYAQAVVVKAAIANGDLSRSKEAQQRIAAAVNATVAGMPEAAGIKIGYAGDLVTGMAEYDLVRQDVVDVGGVGIALVLAVLLIFFRSPRWLIALAVTIGAGCAITFGLTKELLGHLNVATAFLFSIVAGNGINFGIIWLGRFLEERHAGRSLVKAVALALQHTQAATLTAAFAAGTAYAALGIGRFRGFQHFAIIGATGMLIFWLTSFFLLPAVVVLLERRRTRRAVKADRPPYTHYERPFIWVVSRWPGTTLAITIALGLGSAIVGGRYLWKGALEYDMRRLRSDRDTTGEIYRVSHLASRVLASGGSAGMIVMTDHPRDTPLVAELLRKERDKAPKELRPFEDVHTIEDLVPKGQTERLVRLRDLLRRVNRAYERGAIDDKTWAKLSPLLPPPGLQPFTALELPDQLLEPFTEKDGTKGRILYIEGTKGQSDADLHYLLRWADAFRSTHLPDGRVVNGSGYAVIFADLLNASLVDMPRSVLLSLLLTSIAVILMFRRAHAVTLVLGTLALALVWMIGAMAMWNVRLSFINFIALPITFGIGVDYPVNLYGRYAQDPKAGILEAVRGVGGPVILCSLTTMLGYVALLRAHNQAVRSLGAVAVLGEITCLASALLFMPAILTWTRRRAQRRAAS